jgi:hypothetical protein
MGSVVPKCISSSAAAALFCRLLPQYVPQRPNCQDNKQNEEHSLKPELVSLVVRHEQYPKDNEQDKERNDLPVGPKKHNAAPVSRGFVLTADR